MSDQRSKLVYSTDHAVPSREKKPGKSAGSDARPSGGRLSIRMERKGRAGKSVTIIEGLRLDEEAREQLLKQLKSRLGTGGTLKDGVIEIQGDHRDAVNALLRDMGIGPGAGNRQR